MTKILLVEDDRNIAEIEKLYLENAGYGLTLLYRGEQVAKIFKDIAPDLVILDRLLPGGNGLDICRELRKLSEVPVIMVTALGDEQDRLDGFSAGVDDYMCKPFNPPELVARVKAVLKRASRKDDALLSLAKESMCVLAGNKNIPLTRGEFRILEQLMDNAGRVVTREQILENCFADQGVNVFDRSIDNHILNIRKKIAAALPQDTVIHSMYGVGYKYEAPD